MLTDEQIKHMVNRFLSWNLPENFNPDAGISFKAAFNEHTAYPMKHKPSGTNLFDATQADAMVRHMIDGMPPSAAGFVAVPREPTQEMRLAGIAEWSRSEPTPEHESTLVFNAVYRAMINAAPPRS
jgi:hypothetical protein